MTIPRGDRDLARSAAQPCIRLIREDRNHDAVMRIAAKLRGGGPILHGGSETMGVRRVTATSDRHRQSLAGPAKLVVLLCLSFRLLLMRPDARQRPAASRPL